MQTYTIFAILFGAAFAMAGEPSYGSGSSSSDPKVSSQPKATSAPVSGGASCSKGNTVSCCDTQAGDGILSDVLGGSCEIPNLLSLSGNCIAGNTFCCPVNQDGQLNIALACIPISA